MFDNRFQSQGQESYHGFDRNRENRKNGGNEGIYRPSNMTAPFPRRFISNAEFLDFLKTYLKEVEQEAQAVREAIAELENEMSETSKTDE